VERIRRALVTGASDGIGEGFARALAVRGVELVVTARREDRLHRLATELPVDVEVVAADLASPPARARVCERLRDPERPVDLLVNAAGFGAYGRFVDLDPARTQDLLAVNLAALVDLTRAALPGLLERGHGAVVNVGSIAGATPGPFGAVYAASKAFVGSFTHALHEELRDTDVRVMLLAPGVTATGFQAAAGAAAEAIPAVARMEVGPVVATALRDLARGRVVSVPGGLNRLAIVLGPRAPTALSRRVSAVIHRRYLA
jgi:short-subunit dehydrogenase